MGSSQYLHNGDVTYYAVVLHMAISPALRGANAEGNSLWDSRMVSVIAKSTIRSPFAVMDGFSDKWGAGCVVEFSGELEHPFLAHPHYAG